MCPVHYIYIYIYIVLFCFVLFLFFFCLFVFLFVFCKFNDKRVYDVLLSFENIPLFTKSCISFLFFSEVP